VLKAVPGIAIWYMPSGSCLVSISSRPLACKVIVRTKLPFASKITMVLLPISATWTYSTTSFCPANHFTSSRRCR